jgi:hypothetical protein
VRGALDGWDDERLAAANAVLRDLVRALRSTLEA